MFAGQRRFGLDPTVVERAAERTFRAPLNRNAFPAGRMVFTCSWSDWFHPAADEWREAAWEIIRERNDLTFQVLTKRPERIADHLPADWGAGYPNVWLGVSVENRRFVDRADLLRAVPAAVRFISAEPLIGALIPRWDGIRETFVWPDGRTSIDAGSGLYLSGIDWLIAGGESGPGHRHMDPQWVRALRDACALAGTAFFFKQWGGAKAGGIAQLDGRIHHDYPRTGAPT